jgi:hypothetical protein
MSTSGGLEAPGPDHSCQEPEKPVEPAATAPAENQTDVQDTTQSPPVTVEFSNGMTPATEPVSSGSEPPPATNAPHLDAGSPVVLAPEELPVVEVRDLDWQCIRKAVNPSAIRATMRATVERMEALLDRAGGPGMLFDGDRADASDKAIRVSRVDPANPVWFIGDLHGDLLALETALAVICDRASGAGRAKPRIVFLGDLFDDEGFGLEVLLRLFELIAEAPELVCILAGNHDEALSYDGARFASSVAPSDFMDFLNANLAHEWIERAGKLAVRLFAQAPRALFFPDGLLAAHGGFPLVDLHSRLAETENWNDPSCLSDFVWTRAHPKARKKLPNRFSRGSQFGYEDFAAFCSLSAGLGRPVERMVRGHDHVEGRYAIYPAYRAHPVLTTVALSRRLSREGFGLYERVPTIARAVERSLPQVHRLHIPAGMIRETYPEPNTSETLDQDFQESHP